uniref:Ricin B lectin domain-containing protein n=1 Tax=Eptatretus burgeri TaxID=7764 RepID=A0A8C4R7Y2_EPTBU
TEVFGPSNIVWQCGGRMVVVPCSHVSHLSRWDADEDPNTEFSLMNEVVRVATIWLPNYLHVVRMAWDLPSNHEIEIGDVSSRVAMRDRMQCQNFAWFVKKIFPMLSMITDITSYGVLKNGEKEDLCLDQEDASTKKPVMNMCNNLSTQVTHGVISSFKLQYSYRATENCLQLTRDNNAIFKMSLILGSCTGQTWEIVPNKVHE